MSIVFLLLALIAVAALVVLAVVALKNHGVHLLSGLSTAEIARSATVTRLDSQTVPEPIQTQLDMLASRLDHITELLVELADKKAAEAMSLSVAGPKAEKKAVQKKKTAPGIMGSGARKGPRKQTSAPASETAAPAAGELGKVQGSPEA
jgi:hypothetical protein